MGLRWLYELGIGSVTGWRAIEVGLLVGLLLEGWFLYMYTLATYFCLIFLVHLLASPFLFLLIPESGGTNCRRTLSLQTTMKTEVVFQISASTRSSAA